MIRRGGGARRHRESRLGKGLGLLPEIIEEVAALKLLQPVPLCPALDVLMARNLCSGIRFLFARDLGGFPKKLYPGE